MTFAASDEIDVLWSVLNVSPELRRDGQVQVLVRARGPKDPVERSYAVRLQGGPDPEDPQPKPPPRGEGLQPGLLRSQTDPEGRRRQDDRREKRAFRRLPRAGHPPSDRQGQGIRPVRAQFFYYYQLAHQYDRVEINDKAEAAFAKAMSLNPAYKEGIVEFANFLVKVAEIRPRPGDHRERQGLRKARFAYRSIRGLALMGKGMYPEAIAEPPRGQQDLQQRHAIAQCPGEFLCQDRSGRSRRSTPYRASLKLNPDQNDVKKIVQDLEGRNRRGAAASERSRKPYWFSERPSGSIQKSYFLGRRRRIWLISELGVLKFAPSSPRTWFSMLVAPALRPGRPGRRWRPSGSS